jgi:hypothetical protein
MNEEQIIESAAIIPSSAPARLVEQNINQLPQKYEYIDSPKGLFIHNSENGKASVTHLSNFSAKIVKQVVVDDGHTKERHFIIDARVGNHNRRIQIPAASFHSMNWVSEHLGASAILTPGFARKDQARAAIQWASGDVPEETVYAHTGWRLVGGQWVYLHLEGGIGASGNLEDVSVDLPSELKRYRLPDPPANGQLVEDVRTSLDLLQAAPMRITVPLLASVYRAALGSCDFTVHLAGETGGGKTELLALAQQHFGREMDAENLPGSWASTGNALEALAFHAKDAVFAIDDYFPQGPRQQQMRQNQEADRVLRGQGNSAGRSRLRSNGALMSPKEPRGLIPSSGEATPKGESLRARMLVIEIHRNPDDLKWDKLTECQKAAREGGYAAALSGFLQWLAPRYGTVKDTLREPIESLRLKATEALAGVDAHKRLPEIIANLGVGLRYFLDYAYESGALSEAQTEKFWNEGWATLCEAGKAQVYVRAENNPALRFITLLNSAISAGRAHLANEKGGPPETPEAFGWRSTDWNGPRPQGDRVGWVKDGEIYIDPEVANAVVQKLATETGDSIPADVAEIKKHLRNKGCLASVDEKRKTINIRRTLEGSVKNVLHLRQGVVGGKEDEWMAEPN